MFGAVLHPSHHPHHEANHHASRGVVDTSSWTAAEREALVALVGRLSDASSAKSNPQLAGPLHYAELLVMEPEAGKDSAMAATSGLSIIAALAMAASVTSALDPLSDDEHPTLAFWYNICLLYSSYAADDPPCVELGGRRIGSDNRVVHTLRREAQGNQ